MSAGSAIAEAGINRRKFMRRAGVAAVGLAAAAAGAGTSLDNGTAASVQVPLSQINPKALVTPVEIQGDVLGGEILSISADNLVLRPTGSAPVSVEVLPSAYIVKEGEVSLSAFEPGEEVDVLGRRDGNNFTAVGIAPLFRVKEATIYSRKGRVLKTSDGEIALLPGVRTKGGVSGGVRYMAVPIEELKPGDEILAVGILNRQSGRLNAGGVSVRAPGDDPFMGR